MSPRWDHVVLMVVPALLVILYGGDGSWPSTHETIRYPVLAEHFGRAFIDGQLWPRWLPHLNGGHGYPTFVFYPPLLFFLWLPFRFLLGAAVPAMWATIALGLWLGCLGVYRLVGRVDRRVGLLAAGIFLLSPYLWVDWLVRGALSELLASCLVPWPFVFLHAISRDPRGGVKSFVGLAISTAAVFLAHPIVGILLALALGMVALSIVAAPSGIDWRLAARLGLTALAALALTTPYWQPFVALDEFVHLQRAAVHGFAPPLHAVRWWQLFGGSWGRAGSSEGTPPDEMSFELGVVPILCLVMGAVHGWSDRLVRGTAVASFVLILAMTTPFAFLWQLPGLAMMQFPWRCLAVVAALAPLLLVGWAEAVDATARKRLLVFLGLLLIVAGWRPEQFQARWRQVNAERTVQSAVERARFSPETFAARNEFESKFLATTSTPLGTRPIVELVAGQVEGVSGYPIRLTALASGTARSVVINQMYLPGWRVMLDGVAVPDATVRDRLLPDGRMSIELPAFKAARIEARFEPPHAWARYLGVVAGLCLLILVRRLGPIRQRTPAGDHLVHPVPGRGLWRYFFLTLALLGFFLALFMVFELLGLDVLKDAASQMTRQRDGGGAVAAAISLGLLVADVFIPVPSSVIMIGNGALFGIASGAALSLAGSLGAAALGFAIGRRSRRLLLRLVTPSEAARADQLLARWGALAIVITRPLPLLAETLAILAGASPLSWSRMMIASVLGAAPSCLLYAITGATSRSFGGGVLMFTLVVAFAGLLYWLGRRAR